MELRDVLTIVAILVGPIASVAVTMWWQRRKEKRDAKERLFVTLMAHRHASPPAEDWVDSLNVIDVVFARQTKVLDLWHRYYDALNTSPSNTNYQSQQHTYLLMLAEMARLLGYTRLEITDIDKFYSPRAYGDQMQINRETQLEWLRVLRNTARLETVDRDPEDRDERNLPRLETDGVPRNAR